MTYQNKKCPHCNHTIAFMKPKGPQGYGSKIQQCPSCGKAYYDKDYLEIEVDGVRFADRCRIEPFKIIWAAVMVLILFFGKNSLGQTESIVCIALLILSLAFCVKDFIQFPKKKLLIEQERAASAARLSDINYARLLAEKGKSVPRKYLYPEE